MASSPAFGAARAKPAADPYPGLYEGKLWNSKLAIEVGAAGYPRKLSAWIDLKRAAKTPCGKILGFNKPEIPSIKGGKLSWREVLGEAEPDVYKLSGTFANGGRTFEGAFRYSWNSKHSRKWCLTQTPFKATLVRADVIAPWDAGRYAGSISPGGQPISFQVTYDPKTKLGSIVGLSWAVGPMECDSFGEIPQHATITSHLSVSGAVAPTGAFAFPFPPPQTGMTAAEGTLLRGKASGTLHSGGMFDADGTSDDNGAWLCSKAGTPWQNGNATFVARKQR